MSDSNCCKEIEVDLIAITPEPDKVIEQAGRTCYMSFGKMDDSSADGFVSRLLKMGHESPLEHAYASFRVRNCSRAMTHQLVRHRLMAVSQQSQRYVDEKGFTYVMPDSMPQEFEDDYHNDMEIIRQMYFKWRDRGLKKEDARFVLPNSCCSEIVVSANFREWRHIIKLRTSRKAQWEIRKVCAQILNKLKEHSPNCFADIELENDLVL